jgi:hypothetical protein
MYNNPRGNGAERRVPGVKADFQSSHEAPRGSLRVHAWALSSNHNAKQLILIRCKHSQRAARSFVRGLENRLKVLIPSGYLHPGKRKH